MLRALADNDLKAASMAGRAVDQLRSGAVPASRRLSIQPVLVDHAYTMVELVRGARLTGKLRQMERDLLSGKPGTPRELQEAGGTLAGHVKKLITGQRPLGRARLTIHLSPSGDTALALFGTSLSQVIANVLPKQVMLSFGAGLDPVLICPESPA
jgi:hypothetical protein